MKETFKIRYKRKGFKKFLSEQISGYLPNKDKNKFPLGVKISRVIDKEKNIYKEKVIDNKTGKVVRNLAEKLTKRR